MVDLPVMSYPMLKTFSSFPNSPKDHYANEFDFGLRSPLIGKIIVSSLTITRKPYIGLKNRQHHWKVLIEIYNGSAFIFGNFKFH